MFLYFRSRFRRYGHRKPKSVEARFWEAFYVCLQKKSNLMRYLPKPLASPFFVSFGCIIIRLRHLTVFMDGPLLLSHSAPPWAIADILFLYSSRTPRLRPCWIYPQMSRFLRIAPPPHNLFVSFEPNVIIVPKYIFLRHNIKAFTNSKQQPIFGVLYCLCKRKLRKHIFGVKLE